VKQKAERQERVTSQRLTNNSSAKICIIVEPWPDEYTIDPGSTLTLTYPKPTDAQELSLIDVTDDFIVFWCAADIYTADPDGKDVTL